MKQKQKLTYLTLSAILTLGTASTFASKVPIAPKSSAHAGLSSYNHNKASSNVHARWSTPVTPKSSAHAWKISTPKGSTDVEASWGNYHVSPKGSANVHASRVSPIQKGASSKTHTYTGKGSVYGATGNFGRMKGNTSVHARMNVYNGKGSSAHGSVPHGRLKGSSSVNAQSRGFPQVAWLENVREWFSGDQEKKNFSRLTELERNEYEQHRAQFESIAKADRYITVPDLITKTSRDAVRALLKLSHSQS